MNSQSWKSRKKVWGVLGAKNKVEHGQQTGPDQEKERKEQSRGGAWGDRELIEYSRIRKRTYSWVEGSP